MNPKSQTLKRWKNQAALQFRLRVMPTLIRLIQPIIWARRWLHPHKVSLLEAKSRDDQLPLTLWSTAAKHNKNLLFRLAFGGSPRETSLGTVKLRDLFRQNHPAKNRCDLILVETNRSHYDWLKQDGWFFIPAWVSGEVKLPIPEEFLKRETVKSDIRKISRHGFAYEVTQDQKQLHTFFHELHLPFIRKTHGDESLLLTYPEMQKKCGAFDLLLVHKKDRPNHPIAGIQIVYDTKHPRLWSLGLREDGMDYVREGVIAALYLFSFAHALAGGASRIDLGSSRAWLRDGVLNFKRKYSQILTGGSWQGFALKITAFTPGTKKFLLENPFIFSVGDALHGAIFVTEELSGERLQQLDKEFFHPGLAGLVIYTFRDEETFSPATLPAPLAGRVVIRRASELLTPAARAGGR